MYTTGVYNMTNLIL